MPRKASFITLTPVQEQDLKDFMSRNEAPGGDIWVSIRARSILASFRGMTVSQIAKKFGLSERTVWYWRAAYAQHGIDGLK